MRVIITTSGIGERLGHLTANTNKALIKVGDKAAISHIIDSYSSDTEFIITTGYKANLVKEYISLAHPNINVRFVFVANYKGSHSSLPYTLLQTEPYVDGPFIYHACDSLVGVNVNTSDNWIGTAHTSKTSQYRTIKKKDSLLLNIEEKGELYNEEVFIGLFNIIHYKQFFIHCQYVVDHIDNPSDADIINLMIKDHRFLVYNFESWLDIGNVESLKDANKKLSNGTPYLYKQDQSIYIFPEYVIKFFTDPKIVTDIIERQEILKDVTPELLGKTIHFFKYKKAQGHEFAKCLTSFDMITLLNSCYYKCWSKIEDNAPNNLEEFYREKTIQRVKDFLVKYPDIDSFPTINLEPVKPVTHLLFETDWDLLINNSVFSKFVHGDFHNSNIINLLDGDFTLIDWRGNFGSSLYGDIYYDLAKYNHGLLVSHLIVEKENYCYKEYLDGIYINIQSDFILQNCQTVFFKWCADHNYNTTKIELLTALIFLNIATLHHSPYDKFLFCLGKLLLQQYQNRNPINA